MYTKYGSPDVLQLKDVEKPTPKEDEVLVKVCAASLNAYDWHFLTADIFVIRLSGAGLLKPRNTRLGADVAGRVEAVGKNIGRLQPGDEVLGDISEHGNGSFAEYVSAPERAFALKPANLSFDEAAAVPMAAVTALQGLRDAELDAKPSGGGWSVRQIVHHIADGDDIWKLCIKMAIGNELAEFALGWYWSLPQETWADRWAYSQRSIGASLSLLKASREHVLQLLASVPEAWDREAVVRTRQGDIERVPVGYVIQMQADHVFLHIERIHAILREGGGA